MRNFLYKLTTAIYNLGLEPRERQATHADNAIIDVTALYSIIISPRGPLLFELDANSTLGNRVSVLVNAGISRTELQTVVYHCVFRPLDRFDQQLKQETE